MPGKTHNVPGFTGLRGVSLEHYGMMVTLVMPVGVRLLSAQLYISPSLFVAHELRGPWPKAQVNGTGE